MELSGITKDLRRRLEALGVEYEEDDFHAEIDEWSGMVQHVEKTHTERGFAMVAWTRDGDGVKDYQSDLGRYGYIEVDTMDDHCPCTLEEAMQLLI